MATFPHSAILRRRISIRGIVQGVGFRPFVYNLARSAGIRGFVLNSTAGVTIEAEADQAAIEQFTQTLRTQAPPLAIIEDLTTEDLAPAGDSSFQIRESRAGEGEFVMVSGDVATCQECLGEVVDPGNRRFAYPFTNCTNCGPRYSIVRDIPYDRPNTSMAEFEMCVPCALEYHQPVNRRFHAQPNACPTCGPRLALVRTGSSLPPASGADFRSSLAMLKNVRRELSQGAIVALKGLGGFQLACDARNDQAVHELRRRKKRTDKPFAIMAADVAAVETICFLSSTEKELLLSPQRPIVILNRRCEANISPAIAPGNRTLGVMLPYTPLHYLLFGESLHGVPEFTALVMTSGNLSEEPIVTSNGEAWRRLAAVGDWFLFHNRDIQMRVDDSVARVFEGRSVVLRRSRGYVPQAIDLGSPVAEVLACGAQLKNTFCLTKDHYAILSQHIGDLRNYETLAFFEETLAKLKKLFRVEPCALAEDLHPGYLSSRLVTHGSLPRIGVQHHHAHIASCMAENHLRGKVIGVAFDGTGYGTDGQIWGGEFLVADYAGFERRAHFRNITLAGGDLAVRQGWRPAIGLLRDTFGLQPPADLPLFRQVAERELAWVSQMLARNLNTIATSSCGRLFDAVASILGIRQQSTFEGQAAIDLEMATLPGVEDSYSFNMNVGQAVEIDLRPAIRELCSELLAGASTGTIASKFHNTIAAVIAAVCARIQAGDQLERICLSGGTFQNMYLLSRSVRLLRRRGFQVFLQSRVPPNDGGISLGQAVVANAILKGGA